MARRKRTADEVLGDLGAVGAELRQVEARREELYQGRVDLIHEGRELIAPPITQAQMAAALQGDAGEPVSSETVALVMRQLRQGTKVPKSGRARWGHGAAS